MMEKKQLLKKLKGNPKLIFLAAVAVLTAALFWYGQRDNQGSQLKIKQQNVENEEEFNEISENLNIPWELVFLPASPAGGPGGEMLLTERPGKLIKIGKTREMIEISGVAHVGEGGLLGLALHPNFKNNQLIYLYLTTSQNGKFSNRVERYKLDGNKLVDRKIIVEEILGSSIHDGGRIAFGPDGYLYIATGDAGQRNLSQDKNSLNGKILRIRDNGDGLEIYSMGHRNVQGLVWDDKGQLWATEHGPSNFDELNLIEKGKNYGWPVIGGSETKEGMVSPVIHSGDDTWAPSGMTYVNGSLFFAGLRGEALYEYKISEKKLVEHFKNQFGRLRSVTVGPSFAPDGASAGKPDGYLYILTNNRDGRGMPKPGDDKIIRVKIPN